MTREVQHVDFCDEGKWYIHVLITKTVVAFQVLFVSFITGAIESGSKQSGLNETVEMAALLCLNILQISKCTSKPPK